MTDATDGESDKHLGPDCAAARWCSGASPTPQAPGDCCRAAVTSPTPSTGPRRSCGSPRSAFAIGLPDRPRPRLVPRRPRSPETRTAPNSRSSTLLLLLGGGALLALGSPRRTATPDRRHAAATTCAAPTATTAAADTRPSIAVLPFENRSDEGKDAFFVDGIHDDILTQLTKIGAMKVIARTSVEQFRDTKLSTKEIGEKLGVTRVLEGSVQRAGDRVRVTVQLIDTATRRAPVGRDLRPRADRRQHLRDPERSRHLDRRGTRRPR